MRTVHEGSEMYSFIHYPKHYPKPFGSIMKGVITTYSDDFGVYSGPSFRLKWYVSQFNRGKL